MRRRDFITLTGGAAATWPLFARAQQRALPVVGFLSGAVPDVNVQYLDAFRKGLSNLGFEEGRNVAIEYRWANGHQDRLPSLAADLVDRSVSVIATSGGTPSAFAARAATKTIPIVTLTGDDPVRVGLVTSLNQPGGNLTGVTFLSAALEPKRLELLRELVPNVSTVGVMINVNFPDAEVAMKDIPAAARSIGQPISIVTASDEQEIDAAFATLARRRVGAMLVASDPYYSTRQTQFIALAAQYAMPAIYWRREFVSAGGLISYGASIGDAYRQVAGYVGRILSGDRPDSLPFLQAAKFELSINMKTAKALGITIPPKLLFTADEVIE